MTRHLDVDLTHALDKASSEDAAEASAGADVVYGEEARAFLDLPLDGSAAEAALAWAEAAPEARDLVVVGMGGSALPARVVAALRPVGVDTPRLHVVDTVDPLAVGRLLRRLDPASTLVIAASKSGTTLETTAVFPVFEAWLRAALDDEVAARIAIVCGSHENPLRARAEARGYALFDVPPAVGGRFSALTAVGLLPAAVLGVDPRALLAGAKAARARCLGRAADNPALALAEAHAAAEAAGRGVAVLLPYGEALRPLGPWWAQLVGESLGKPAATGPVGVTPVAASGPADQHSLLQLLVEGPDDKLTVFVDAGGVMETPRVPADAADLCFAAGRDLGAILRAEREATAYALAASGRPSIRVHLAAADAASVGAFLLTYEAAVVLWAERLGVNPFGQPGVTLGKDAARAALTGEPADLAARMQAQGRRAR